MPVILHLCAGPARTALDRLGSSSNRKQPGATPGKRRVPAAPHPKSGQQTDRDEKGGGLYPVTIKARRCHISWAGRIAPPADTAGGCHGTGACEPRPSGRTERRVPMYIWKPYAPSGCRNRYGRTLRCPQPCSAARGSTLMLAGVVGRGILNDRAQSCNSVPSPKRKRGVFLPVACAPGSDPRCTVADGDIGRFDAKSAAHGFSRGRCLAG